MSLIFGALGINVGFLCDFFCKIITKSIFYFLLTLFGGSDYYKRGEGWEFFYRFIFFFWNNYYFCSRNATLAQLVERRIRNA